MVSLSRLSHTAALAEVLDLTYSPSYDLPHRVYCSKYYPISPQPSIINHYATTPSIFVYGHDQGVTVVWKGFKEQERAASGEHKNQAMVSKAPRKRTAAQVPDLENPGRRRRLRRDLNTADEGGDARMLDVSGPTPQQPSGPPSNSATQTHGEHKDTHAQTVHLGTAVYDISFLPSSILASISPTVSPDFPIVVPEDSQIPLSTLLLQNYIVMAVVCSDNSVRLISLPLRPTPSEAHQEISLSGFTAHRSLPTALSLTLVPSPTKLDQLRTSAPSYEFLIASSSADISGRLLLWRVALASNSSNGTPVQFNTLLSLNISLSHPALHMSFNPSSSSSLLRHNLLLADTSGGLRIYDTNKGHWLLCLYMDYPAYGQTRKKILGADWCLDGQAIVVLGGDGEWGIFELVGKGRFLPCGKVGETLDSSNGKKRYRPGDSTIFSGSSTASSSTGGGTNMGARFIRSNFSANTASLHGNAQTAKGNLAITVLPGQRAEFFAGITPKGIPGSHEMLAVAFEDQLLVVPSIQETLAVKKRGSNEKSRVVELKNVVLGGENIVGLDIRWLVSRKPRTISSSSLRPPTPPTSSAAASRPLSRSSEFQDIFGRQKSRRSNTDEDDYLSINNDENVINNLLRSSPSSETETCSPKVSLVIAAGCRLSVLNIDDEVLSTASKPLVIPVNSGLAARIGPVGIPANYSGYSSLPNGEVFGIPSGTGKRKAGL